MAFWQRLLRALGFARITKRTFHLDAHIVRYVQMLAEREQRPADDLATDLLNLALAQRVVDEERLRRWYTLSPREQEIAALICLGLTNRQIASRLIISPETVKTHTQRLLQKFGMHSKIELRRALSDWDFSAWE